MVFLVHKKLICIAFLALSSVDVTFAQDSAAPIEEEAPTAMPILSGVSTPTEAPTEMPILSGVGTPTEMPILSGVGTPTEMPILPGSDRDENGCIPSAGYSWCDPLKECIKSWETDCPGTTTPSPTKSPIQDSTPSPTKSPVQGPTPSSPTAPVNPAAEAQATETAVINNDVKVEVSSAALLTSSMMGMAAVTTAFVAMA